MIEDNEYAISVPVEVQTAGRQHQPAGGEFPQFPLRGVRRLRPAGQLRGGAGARWSTFAAGNGPALVHGHVIRPYSHSLSDDEKLYRPEAERRTHAERDPITRFQLFLIREGILDEHSIGELEKSVDEEVQQAADRGAERPASGHRQLHRTCVLGRPRSHLLRF